MDKEKLAAESIHSWLEDKAKSYGEAERNHFLLALNVFQLGQKLSAAFAQVAKCFGLTSAEYRTLLMLRPSSGAPNLTPGDLLALTHTTSGGMAKILKTLESRGLIERAPNPCDARSNLIGLTAAGETLVDQIFPLGWKAGNMIFSETLSCEETRELARLLNKVIENSDAELVCEFAAARQAG